MKGRPAKKGDKKKFERTANRTNKANTSRLMTRGGTRL